MFIILYINDFLIMIKDNEELTSLKRELTIYFKMKDIKEIKWFLGMKIEYESNDIKIHQMNYIHILLHRYEMQDCNFINISMNSSIKLIVIINSNIKVDFS